MTPLSIMLAFQPGTIDVRGTLAVVAVEFAAAAFVAGVCALVARWLAPKTARRTALGSLLLLAAGILGYNAWLVIRGTDVRSDTLARLSSLTVETWQGLLLTLGKVGVAGLGLLLVMRVARRSLAALADTISRPDEPKDRQLRKLFTSLDHAIVNTAGLGLVTFACWMFEVSYAVVAALLLVMRIYVIVSGGLLLIRAIAFIVELLDRRGRRYADHKGWIDRYDHLRRLLPTLSACLEYVLWIGMASLVVMQLAPAREFATWGPRLVEAIAIFFACRVLIELGHLEIDRRMLTADGLDDVALRRRATMTPLVHSVFTYAGYFGTAVVVLAMLGFNAMPFLAGAGILGVVVGFGAQSLINDVVSGFFILFENVYLVGELIEVEKAKGIVEAIEFRVTKIRDDEGRLHVIRNGDMKPVINYSKEFTMAVVPVDVAYDADLRSVFSTLREAGRRVRADDRNVLSDTRIDGITAFGASAMTVKTSTKVRPGSHEGVAAALRLAIKESFDRLAAEDAPRNTLIPRAAAQVHSSN